MAGPGVSSGGAAPVRSSPEEVEAWLAAEVRHHRPPRLWKLLQLAVAASGDHAFLDRPWIAPLLRLASLGRRRDLAVRLLGLSPHYWIYQWSNRYPPGLRRGQILESEVARVAASREALCQRLLGPYLRPGMTVLDLGTGPGFLAKSLSRHVFAVLATDVSRGAIACARELNPAENLAYLVQAPDRLTGVDDGTIDLVCSFAVLQHLPPDRLRALLAEIVRVLKPGGQAFCHLDLADPGNPRQWLTRERSGWLERHLLPRMVYFRPEEIMGRVAEAGGVEVEIHRVADLAELDCELGREHLVTFRRPGGGALLGGRGRERAAGPGWADRLLSGSRGVSAPGAPWTMALRRELRSAERGIALFNHLAVPVAATVTLRCEAGARSATVELGAGESRFLAELPPTAGPCLEVRLEVSRVPCATTAFISGDHLHVFLMSPDWRGELPAIGRRYALADPGSLLGPFRPHVDPAFPDPHGLQKRLYDYLLARSTEGVGRLIDPDPAVPTLPVSRRIPRAVHWIWLRSPLAEAGLEEEYLWRMHTWAARNPSFDLHLWTDAGPAELLPEPAVADLFHTLFGGRVALHGAGEIRALLAGYPLANRKVVADLLLHLNAVAARSDLLRLLILHAEGGLYCDLNDTECLAPLGALCDRFSFVIGVDRHNRVHNAVLGSAPGHRLVAGLLASLETGADALNRQIEGGSLDDYTYGLLGICGPAKLSAELSAAIERGEVAPPEALLLPFPFFHNPEVRQPTPLSLVHHFSVLSWLVQEKQKRGIPE